MVVVAGRTGEGYDLRLSSSLLNLALVAVADFLRDHRLLRVGAAILAVGLAFGGLTVFMFPIALYRIGVPVHPELSFRIAVPAMVLGGALLLAVLFSGARFNVVVAESREVEERRAAETEVREAGAADPFAYLDLDSKRLSEYYAIDQEQARSSFRWAVFVMLLGLSTILTGLWMFYFRESTQDTFLASLTTVAGLLSNFISATFLYLYSQVTQRSTIYYGQLTRLQLLGVSIRLAQSHQSEEQRAAAKDRVIEQILGILKENVASLTVPAR